MSNYGYVRVLDMPLLGTSIRRDLTETLMLTLYSSFCPMWRKANGRAS